MSKARVLVPLLQFFSLHVDFDFIADLGVHSLNDILRQVYGWTFARAVKFKATYINFTI